MKLVDIYACIEQNALSRPHCRKRQFRILPPRQLAYAPSSSPSNGFVEVEGSQSELQVKSRIDCSFQLGEFLREIVFQGDIGQRKLDKIGIRLNSGLLLCLRHKIRAHSACNTIAFFAQKASLLGCLNDGSHSLLFRRE